MQKMHKTHPGTGAVCTAAAIRIPGSIPHRLLRRSADTRTIIHIGHPAGIMDVESVSHMEAGTPVIDKLAFTVQPERSWTDWCTFRSAAWRTEPLPARR